MEAGQHTLGFDIIGEITGKYVTGYSYNLHRRLFHIDAIELKPQHTRLWLITPWGFDDLANDLAAYIRQAHSLDTPQTVATQPTETGTDEGQQGRPDRPPITDPIDQAIWAIVSDDPDLKDDQVAARLAEDYDIRNDEGLPLSRQAINPRRRTLEKMGYKVR